MSETALVNWNSVEIDSSAPHLLGRGKLFGIQIEDGKNWLIVADGNRIAVQEIELWAIPDATKTFPSRYYIFSLPINEKWIVAIHEHSMFHAQQYADIYGQFELSSAALEFARTIIGGAKQGRLNE